MLDAKETEENISRRRIQIEKFNLSVVGMIKGMCIRGQKVRWGMSELSLISACHNNSLGPPPLLPTSARKKEIMKNRVPLLPIQ